MTADEIIDEILVKEGGFREQVRRPDGSIDPHTKYGITADTLGNWRGMNRPASRGEVWNLSQDEARAIYQAMFIEQPGFTKENVPFEPLRIQLIDFGVNSGPERAVRWLQRILRIPTTGILDATTLDALQRPGEWFIRNELVNDALVAARSYMIDRSVDQGIMRKVDEEGVESRALSFFLAKP